MKIDYSRTLFDGDDKDVDFEYYKRILDEKVFVQRSENTFIRLGMLKEQLKYLPSHRISERLSSIYKLLDFKSQNIHPGRFDTIPFSDLFLSTVENCWAQIVKHYSYSNKIEPYNDEIVQELQRGLVQTLSDLSWRCLYFEFNNYRENTPEFSYNKFIHELKENECKGFFDRFPVLKRIIGIACEQWLKNIIILTQRLGTDFPNSNPISIKYSGSDRHKGGCSVFFITFQDGSKWVYKPRDLSCEYAFVEFQKKLNQLMHGSPFHCYEIIVKKDYGWVEYIEHCHCPINELSEFYFNSGALLGLLWLLGATDAHKENVRACGTKLSFIDAETLLMPIHSENSTLNSLDFDIADSALRTGLLPRWLLHNPKAGSSAIDISGLGATSKGISFAKQPIWFEVNSDQMKFKFDLIEKKQNEHLPGKESLVYEYRENLLAGFRSFLEIVLSSKVELLGKTSPLHLFKNAKVRYVHRPTLLYRTLLEKSLLPEFQVNGYLWSSQLDLLSLACLNSEGHSDLWSIQAFEISDLLELDIPYFTIGADENTLISSTGYKLINFHLSGLQATRLRIASLKEEKINFHTAVIRESLMAVRPTAPSIKINSAHNKSYTISKEDCINAAVKIGKGLIDSDLAKYGTWLGLSYIHEAKRFQFKDVGVSLFGGTAGICLFLAAIGEIKHDSKFRQFAEDLMEITLLKLNTHISKLKFYPAGGALEGPSSVLYSLALLSRIAPKGPYKEFLENNLTLFNWQEQCRVATKTVDFVNGATGMLFVCNALATVGVLNSEVVSEVREIIIEKISNDPKLINLKAGMSHGVSSGIFSLAQSNSKGFDSRTVVVLKKLIELENSFFDKSINSWPDMRSKPYNFSHSWCNGALGILIARDAAQTNSIDVDRDIQIAKSFIKKSQNDLNPTLCCGSAGLAMHFESLDYLSPTNHDSISQLIHSILHGSKLDLVSNISDDVRVPGLFLGEAGIGYALLRVGMPGCLPNLFNFK
jgi:type 2 lantibiotic biosynthesis protein LanM